MEETKLIEKVHPLEEYFRKERLPHIWCSGCGLGIAMSSLLYAIKELEIPREKIAIVSGIGCSGRVAGYVRVDSYHTTHGRPIAFATGLKIARPDLNVIVFSGDGDIAAIGGNHLIHAARRNMDITVICVNNFNYGMTGGQFGPTTPLEAITTTTPYGNFEYPFNLPHLAASSGATFVARWTVLHAYQLRQSIKKALSRKGFNFIEVISPCPTGFGRPNKIGEPIDEMRYYKENSVIRNGIDPKEAELSFRGKIVVGEFVEIEKPSYLEIYQKFLEEKGIKK
uniref:2-oxoacid:ferredoxin oxidoreductase subunit beta n=1 Tax=candidate division WOR-3 bacterium TaxID=2052148 RepID=A0A7V3ZSM2_UNCW3